LIEFEAVFIIFDESLFQTRDAIRYDMRAVEIVGFHSDNCWTSGGLYHHVFVSPRLDEVAKEIREERRRG
jgi:hypothetical protein